METSEFAGKTVTLNSPDPAFDGQEYHVEDWWINVTGGSWMFANGNPAAINYAIHGGTYNLPIDDNVLYGKIGGLGYLVHISEVAQ